MCVTPTDRRSDPAHPPLPLPRAALPPSCYYFVCFYSFPLPQALRALGGSHTSSHTFPPAPFLRFPRPLPTPQPQQGLVGPGRTGRRREAPAAVGSRWWPLTFSARARVAARLGTRTHESETPPRIK